MTPEQARQRALVMLAYADGKAVQGYVEVDGAWVDSTDPSFSPLVKWRVKPEPPDKPEPREAWVIYNKKGSILSVVDNDDVAKQYCNGGGGWTYRHMREVTPC